MTGFNQSITVTSCSTYTLSYKLSYAYKLYQVSYIGLIISAVSLIGMLVMLIIGVIKYFR